VPRRDVTLTDTLASIENIKNQTPNTSHQQLEEITVVLNLKLHMLHSSKRNCEMNIMQRTIGNFTKKE
jgi:hypothetical protein